MPTAHRSISMSADRTPGSPRKFRTLYLDPADLLDLASHHTHPKPHADAEEHRDEASGKPAFLTPDHQARLLANIRTDVRDAAAAVLAWLDHALADNQHDPHTLLGTILRPGPDPSAVQRPALCAAIAEHTGVELSPKRLATALRHLRAIHTTKAEPRRGPVRASPTHGYANRCLSEPDLTDARPLALGLLAALRQAVGRRTDRDYADALPDDPVSADALEADTLNYLRRALPHGQQSNPASLHELLLTLAPLTAPDAPRPTADSDLQLVLHAAPAIASLLGPDSLPATLAHLNTLVMLRDAVAHPVYLAEMLRLTHHAASLKTDADTLSLHRYAKRHRLPNPPGATRVSSYAAVNACTRLLQRLFDGELQPDTLIDVPPSWRQTPPAPHDNAVPAWPLAAALLEHLETTDAGFALSPTTRLLFHTVEAQHTNNTEPALQHYRKLGPSKTQQRLAALAAHDNHDAMVAATAALAKRAFPQLDLATVG
ncbi:MAG: hypothetical protein AAGF84_12410 [Planctomycetota bacterium]